MPSTSALPSEAERDRVPHFRRYRDLSHVSTPCLERTVDRLGEAVTTLRKANVSTVKPLLDGIADCERELIRRRIEAGRSDSRPAVEVERVSHVLRSGSGARLIVAP